MKLIARIQLLPSSEDAARLKATMERFNEAADFAAGVAFGQGTSNVFDVRRLCYAEVRARFELPSQTAQLAIIAACHALRRDGSARPRFRRHSAVAYDRRVMSFKGIDRVSLMTLDGRVVVPFVVGAYDAKRLGSAGGQSDLIYRGGRWYLHVTVDVPDGSSIETEDVGFG